MWKATAWTEMSALQMWYLTLGEIKDGWANVGHALPCVLRRTKRVKFEQVYSLEKNMYCTSTFLQMWNGQAELKGQYRVEYWVHAVELLLVEFMTVGDGFLQSILVKNLLCFIHRIGLNLTQIHSSLATMGIEAAFQWIKSLRLCVHLPLPPPLVGPRRRPGAS